MGKVKLILGFALMALAVMFVWQIAAAELANFELQDDLQDLAALTGARIGLAAPSTDDDLRGAVIRKAKAYEIELDPKQVMVQRTGTAEAPVLYLAADYEVSVNLPGYSFTLHFTPSGRKKGF